MTTMSTILEPETQQRTAVCETCGQYFSYEPIWIFGRDFGKTLNRFCQDCQNAAEKAGRDAERIARAERIEALINSEIPPDLLATNPRRADFNSGLWELVSKWRPGGEFWLGIVGEADSCKTRCMALLAMKAMRAGVRVTWTTAIRVSEAANDRKSKHDQERALAREHLAECLNSGWLFVDDLGKNEWGVAFESQFFKILDYRKNHRMPVVYSSNAHPSEFSQVLSRLNSAPIIGRLLDRVTLIDLTK
jgi:hypothetical protein